MKKILVTCAVILTVLTCGIVILPSAAEEESLITTTTVASENAYVNENSVKSSGLKGYLPYTTLGKRVPAMKFSLQDIREKLQSGTVTLKSVKFRIYLRGRNDSAAVASDGATNFQPYYSAEDAWTSDDTENFPSMTLGSDGKFTANEDCWKKPIADSHTTIPAGAGYASDGDIGAEGIGPFYYDFDITTAVTEELEDADDAFFTILLGMTSGKSKTVYFFGKDHAKAAELGYQPQLIAEYEAAKPEALTVARTLYSGSVNKFAELYIPSNTASYTKLTSTSCKDILLRKLADGDTIFAGQIRSESQQTANEYMYLRGAGTGSTVMLKITYLDGETADFPAYDTGSSAMQNSSGHMAIRKTETDKNSYGYFKIDIASLAEKALSIQDAVIGINPYNCDKCGEFTLGFYEIDKTDWNGAEIIYNNEPAFAASIEVQTVTGGEYVVNTRIINDYKTDKTVAALVGLYCEDNGSTRLEHVYTLNATVSAGTEKSVYTQVVVPDDGKSYQIKAFLWNDFNDLKPYLSCEIWN